MEFLTRGKIHPRFGNRRCLNGPSRFYHRDDFVQGEWVQSLREKVAAQTERMAGGFARAGVQRRQAALLDQLDNQLTIGEEKAEATANRPRHEKRAIEASG